MSRERDLYGVFSNLIQRTGYQNWLNILTEDKPQKSPSSIALKLIENVEAEEIGKWVMDVVDYSIAFRDTHYLCENWEACRNLYNGEYFEEENVDENSAKIITNWLRELVRTRAAYTTANQMGMTAYSVEASDNFKAEHITDSISWVFYNNNFPILSYDGRVEAEVLGTSYYRVDWDNDLTPPYGDVRLRLVQPDRIIVDWNAEELQQGRFVGELHYKTMEEIVQIWPDKEAEITSSMSKSGEKCSEYIEVIELFLVDRTTEKIRTTSIEIVNGVEMLMGKEVEKPKYPNGRRIIVSNGVVLSDEPMAAEMLRNGVSFPFAVGRGSRQPHEQFGLSTVAEYESMVRDIIKRECNISDILERFTHPVVLVADRQFKNPQTQAIFDRDIIWNYTPRPNVPAPQLLTPPPGILNNNLSGLTHLKADFQTLSGMVDVAVGETPGSLRTGRGILALQQRVDMRNAPMINEHGETMKTLAKIILAFIQVGYTEERILRRIGERGRLEFTRINQTSPDGARINDPTIGQFDIMFDVNSGTPTNYMARLEESTALVGAGIMDVLTAIERSDLPDKAAVVMRGVLAGRINPIAAVRAGWIAEDDPIVQMMMQQAGQQAQPVQAGNAGGGQGQGGQTSPELTFTDYKNIQ